MTYKEARDFLSSCNNQVVRSLLGRISTMKNSIEASLYVDQIEKAYNLHQITDKEHEALRCLLQGATDFINQTEIRLPFSEDANLTSLLKERIWMQTNSSNVMQFRNCVTDMMILEVITMEEYIELNNEIDRYITYSLSDGHIK